VTISFDSNILIYASDSSQNERHRIATEVIGGAIHRGEALIPLQALGEFYHVRTRKLRRSRDETRGFIDGWRRTAWVEPYGEADIEAAMDCSQSHGLSFWDAMIWAVSERAGASLLATEDLQAGRRLGGVTFVDPFDPSSHRRLGLSRPLTPPA
jgi:predicted nucleic acid-binding protein